MEGLRTMGPVAGPFSEEKLVCQFTGNMIHSKGIFLGDDPFNFSLPMLLAQGILILLLTRTTYYFLKPLGQGMISAQIIAGIIMGPSILGHDGAYAEKLFPPGGKLVLETLANVGFMLHLFLVGLQMDPRILKKAGKTAVLIGIGGFILPYGLGELAFIIIHHVMTLDRKLSVSIPFMVALNSMTSFVVVSSLLTDLNILNSELGRLATQTSMVSDLCSWFMATMMNTVGIAARDSDWMLLWSLIWLLIFLISIVFVFRPIIIWISKQTPEGERMDEVLFFIIIVMIMGCAFCAEVLGQHAALGPLVLGMALPDGPPIGTILLQKFDTMVTGLLLPIFFALSGSKTKLFSLGKGMFPFMVEFIIILGYIGKFTGTLIPAIFSGVPRWDSLCLAMIMCCKGIIEVATYSMWKDRKILSYQSYSLLLITMLIVTGVCRPIVGYLYDPASSHMSYSRKSIMYPKHDSEFRILVCIHNEHNVSTIINLLEASHATKSSPISIVALCLMELTGSSSSVLESYDSKKKLTSGVTHLGHIINAFNYYEQHNHGRVTVQHFTAIAPYSSMHTDICAIALEMRANIVIVPFHKQMAFGGTEEATATSIKTVNLNVIDKAPCSVGILVDRGHIGGHRSFVAGHSLYHIALLFLGGADDREALSYSRRMAEDPKIRLTVVCFRPWGEQAYTEETEEYLDKKLMNEFKADAVDKIVYSEVIVKDGEGTTQVIRSMEEGFDLFIVGRHHDKSPFTLGLTEWHECTELGLIGDMLAGSDFLFSVLVVQQQPFGLGVQDLSLNGAS
ncbi:hypothetical protein VitviT2T_008414 [Vitis vinifera]|uniref:Cation/H+ exchanger domain-containing protein n=2 Tax=Vitis vinifera TaxID=29760 RepID=A0ABY9C2D9_VITVI|nr:cation/H(+) antiporter 14 [Vitis vinifera]WJZ89179.1 hypothetical protein VitviT2T_008414 [Vitis vinifera]|eukprot:XP_002277552.1 PREDICTED: cation/H(+) antiporter 14 [Vitis vinifera]